LSDLRTRIFLTKEISCMAISFKYEQLNALSINYLLLNIGDDYAIG
jgi:hypothetical protein